jgi:hypothetical protein
MIRIPSSWAVLPSIRGVPHIGNDESRTPTQWHPERGGPIYITMHSRLSLSSPFSRWITRSPVVTTSPPLSLSFHATNSRSPFTYECVDYSVLVQFLFKSSPRLLPLFFSLLATTASIETSTIAIFFSCIVHGTVHPATEKLGTRTSFVRFPATLFSIRMRG